MPDNRRPFDGSRMPAAFFGWIKGTAARCGLCQRVVTVHADPKAAAVELRAEGWTWRQDCGWCCSCRHAYGNLDPAQDPVAETKRRQSSGQRKKIGRGQRYPRPTARVRKIIKRRNRNFYC